MPTDYFRHGVGLGVGVVLSLTHAHTCHVVLPVISTLPLEPPRSALLIKPGLLIRPDLIYCIGGET